MLVLLFTTVVDWEKSLTKLAKLTEKRRAMAVLESFEEEGGDALRTPLTLDRYLERIHVVGPAAAPLSKAVISATFARRMEAEVREAFATPGAKSEQVLENFQMFVSVAADQLGIAIGQMGDYLHMGSR
ncbi:hypothetical protein [Xanthomonas sp. 1678]|uniref:hypothetical protein n=1 Tax=Xanthomonas sp. 1678 TaxID=3158788 RepID=UPI002863B5A4|nr:hypothetical protein [Xanthomonas translucens]